MAMYGSGYMLYNLTGLQDRRLQICGAAVKQRMYSANWTVLPSAILLDAEQLQKITVD